MKENFLDKSKLESLFSAYRLSGYIDENEHEENLRLIKYISHKIGIAELIVRNKIDTLLSIDSSLWIYSLPDSILLKGEKSQDKNTLISLQNLGFWIKIVELYKIHNQIFNIDFLDNLNFKKYFYKNKSHFTSRHNRLLRHHKAEAILKLLRLLRNRAFHFENLYKMNKKGPRLSVKITNKYHESVILSLHPSKIVEFLDDILMSFDKDLLYYAE